MINNETIALSLGHVFMVIGLQLSFFFSQGSNCNLRSLHFMFSMYLGSLEICSSVIREHIDLNYLVLYGNLL